MNDSPREPGSPPTPEEVANNPFLSVIKTLEDKLKEEDTDEMVHQWIEEQVFTAMEPNSDRVPIELVHQGAVEIAIRSAVRDPLLAPILTRRPDALLFPLMMAIIVGYIAAQRTQE